MKISKVVPVIGFLTTTECHWYCWFNKHTLFYIGFHIVQIIDVKNVPEKNKNVKERKKCDKNKKKRL